MTEEATSTEQQSVSITDLEPKTRLEGTVVGTGLHGAVVDIGLPYEGLLHISQLTPDNNVDLVTDAVESGQHVTVWVTEVDPEKGRVSLTMVEPPDVTWDELRERRVYSGVVTRIEQYGAFVDIGAERPGLLHVREMSSGYVAHPSEMVSVGDEIDVRVLKVDRRRQRIDLTRQGLEEAVEEPEPEEPAEEEEVAPQTMMEIALERAYADRERKTEGPGKGRGERESAFSVREEILERTLKEHSES